MRTTIAPWMRVVAGVLGVALAGVLTGCANGSGSSGNIRIGVSLPLTGEFSQGGQDTQNGYDIWVEMQNEAGGLLGRQVEIIVKDDATNQNTAVTNYNNLIDQEGVDLLLGTQSSLLNIAASAVAERAGMLYICASCASPDMFNRGFTMPFFSQQALAAEQGNTFANWVLSLPSEQQPKRVAYVSLDDPFASPVVDGVKNTLEEAGLETVYSDIYPAATKNFDTIATAIRDANADMIVQGAQFEDGVNFIRSMNRVSLAPKILYQSSSPTYGDQYVQGVGEENAQGVMFSASYNPAAKTDLNAEFVKRYQDKYQTLPPEDAADGFAAGQVLAAAVTAVGNLDDQEQMADWLRSNSVDTILGTLKWNEDGSPNGDFPLDQWQDGKNEVLLPEGISTTDKVVAWRGGDL